MNDLLPCPFCGGDASFYKHADDCYFIILEKLKRASGDDALAVALDLRAAWNLRAESGRQSGGDAKKKRFDRLQDILAEYYKGCSNTLGEGPENCPECVCAFVKAVQRYADRQSSDAEDAARYRWLRDIARSQDIRWPLMGKPHQIDAAIDAARESAAPAQRAEGDK